MNGDAPTTDANKVAWPNWTTSARAQLTQADLDTCVWFDSGAVQVPMNPTGLTDEPQNVHPNVGTPGLNVMQWVTGTYMWDDLSIPEECGTHRRHTAGDHRQGAGLDAAKPLALLWIGHL